MQPIFPLFRREAFDSDLRDKKVSESLLYMMFALASRYVPPSQISQTFGPDVIEPWDDFARMGFNRSRFNEEKSSNTPMSLEDVMISLLLTLHEYTSFPGHKAWMRIGNTVRIAIAAGLHRIDQPEKCNAYSFSAAELEERRFTWWAVWRVDSSINILASSPFTIETCDILTALPSASTADFTNSKIPSCSLDFLSAHPIKPWTSTKDLQQAASKDSPNFYLQTVSYNREAVNCRRRLHLNPTPRLASEFNDLKHILSYMKVALPCSFFSGIRRLTDETIDQHRQRLESLILLHMLVPSPLITCEAINQYVIIMQNGDSHLPSR